MAHEIGLFCGFIFADWYYALFAYIISDIAQKELERFAGFGLK
jgi:hypothetical protein